MANELDTVAIVGGGVIGAGWATHFLARGYRVIATDPGDGAKAALRGWVDGYWPVVEQLGPAEGASKANLSFTADVAHAVRDAFFIQESGPERLDDALGVQGAGLDLADRDPVANCMNPKVIPSPTRSA